MAQLKPAFIQEIKHALDEKFFTANDYQIDLPDTGAVLVKITFNHKSGYSLVCKEISKSKDFSIGDNLFNTVKESRQYTVYEVEIRPGHYKTVEKTELAELGGLVELIPEWCEAVHDDLVVLVPKHDELEELRKKFTRDIEENISNPDHYFSDEEKRHINAKLDELMAQLEQLQEEHKLTKKQLKQIEEEFKQYKSNAVNFSKGLWAKVTSNRLLKTIGEWANTPEGRKLVMEQVRKLLTGE